MSSAPEPSVDLDALVADASEMAREAGRIIRQRHGEHRAGAGVGERQKGHAHNVVTAVDLESEATLVRRIVERYPEHGIRSEEGAIPLPPPRPDRPVWVIDPLDGTNNFAHGYPFFAVNVALMLGDRLLVGVTFDPLRDELFVAAEGRGARLNGRPIRVSERTRLAESMVATGFPYDKATNPDNNLPQLCAVAPRVRGIRRSGSAALDLAYVAAGRLDAYWERGTCAWDVAAGILLIREAGGTVTDYEGRAPTVDAERYAASNGRVHAELLAALAGAGMDAGAEAGVGARVSAEAGVDAEAEAEADARADADADAEAGVDAGAATAAVT